MAQSTICFIIFLFFGPQKLKTSTLLDSKASASFLNEEFAKNHKIFLVQKAKPVQVEVIDERLLLSDGVTYESKPIEVAFEDHCSYIIFNIIRTLSNPIILGLSWLEKYNQTIDWRLQKMTFSIEHFKSKQVKKS